MEISSYSNVSPRDLYLAIALTKNCNKRCGYCHPFGESKITHGTDMSQKEFAEVLDSAYKVGFKTYRFTGGEPTIVSWFKESLDSFLDSHSDVNVNICTNGAKLDDYLNIFQKYSNQVGLRISLDSLDPSLKEKGIDKILTPSLHKTFSNLRSSGIYTRFNTVVTQINKDQIMPIIDYAQNFGFDVKLLDLYVQDKYIATHGKNVKKFGDPAEYWKKNYFNLEELTSELFKKSNGNSKEYNKDGGFGIPMYSFNLGDIKVIFKDSTKGAHFSRSNCISSCPLFGSQCQEGVYTPHVSSNLILHINGCANKELQWNLKGTSNEGKIKMFSQIINCFQDLEIRSPPKTINNFVASNLSNEKK